MDLGRDAPDVGWTTPLPTEWATPITASQTDLRISLPLHVAPLPQVHFQSLKSVIQTGGEPCDRKVLGYLPHRMARASLRYVDAFSGLVGTIRVRVRKGRILSAEHRQTRPGWVHSTRRTAARRKLVDMLRKFRYSYHNSPLNGF